MSKFDDYDSAYLEALEGEYERAVVKPSYIKLPPGTYRAAVVGTQIVENSNPDRAMKREHYYEHMLMFELEVLEGEYRGGRFSKYDGLSLYGMKYVKKDLTILGVTYRGLRQLERDVIEGKMIGIAVDLRATQKVSASSGLMYTNYWFARYAGRVDLNNLPSRLHAADDEQTQLDERMRRSAERSELE